MATATADSSLARPLALRMRPDLIVAPQRVAGRRCWAVKDPVAMSYFRLRDEERAVLEMLDGHTSAEEIIAQFEHRFAPRRLTAEQLHAYCTRLHADGLLVSNHAGQGDQLLDRHRKAGRRRIIAAAGNVLAIRLPGVNPAPLLDWLYPAVRWIFSPLAIAASLSLVVAALLLITTRFSAFAARLPNLQDYVTARDAIFLLLAISLTKVIHELGHALVCRHFGGECHEMGPMLLFFAPCLYCNVSDSWMFASRWRRIAVAAAGIYVEIVLAAIATFIWWFSEPGLVAAIALSVMTVCSLNTLLFNGNPLLRYDGYYVLSDLVDIPNLAEQSSRALRNLARRVLGLRLSRAEELPLWRRVFLQVYAVASSTYRLLLVATLLWCSYRLLLPYRLEVLAELLGFLVVAGMVAGPVRETMLAVQRPTTGTRWPRLRFCVVLTALAAVLAAVAMVPLPVNVVAPVVIEPRGAERIYVSEPGLLTSCVRAGERVEAGQTVAQLANADLTLEIVRLEGDQRRQQLHLANLERRRGQDRTAAAEIPMAREALADISERLERRRADQQRLTLAAPTAGIVMPPEARVEPQPSGALGTWQRTPLAPENAGAMLETGTLLCLVGDPHRMDAVAIVDQADVERIALGDRVQLKLNQGAGAILWGTVREIAEIDVDVAPRQLSAASELAVRKDEVGVVHPLSASYQVRIEFDEHDLSLLVGARGRAKVHAAPQSLFARARRWVRGAFHFGV